MCFVLPQSSTWSLELFSYIVLLLTFQFYFFRLSVIHEFCLLRFFCFRVLGLFRRFHTHTHTTMLNAHPTIFYFQVLGLLSSFSFVSIDSSRCTKKNWSVSILFLISNFLRQMRYRRNRHHSYIVNIVFLNNLVQV